MIKKKCKLHCALLLREGCGIGSRLFGLFRALYLAGLPIIASLCLQVLVIILIHGLHICKFTYSLKFTCNPQINTVCPSTVIHDHVQSVKNLRCPIYTLLAESVLKAGQGNVLPSYSSTHAVGERPFYHLLSVTFFAFSCFFVVDFAI